MPKGADSFIKKITQEAGAAVLKRFGKDGVHYMKSEHRSDAVTKADLLADKIITSRIKARYPSHGIISEESGKSDTEAEYVWIIDPIDGTLNFSLGVPLFGVMVCLTRKRTVIMSAIYLPTSNEMFFAKAGKGTFLNGKRIRTSQVPSLEHTIGACGMSLVSKQMKFLNNILAVAKKKKGVVLGTLGSMAISACYVASGRRDWMTTFAGQMHDFAPVSLILKEAGCTITNSKGRPWKLDDLEIVAANPSLHKELLKLTKNV